MNTKKLRDSRSERFDEIRRRPPHRPRKRGTSCAGRCVCVLKRMAPIRRPGRCARVRTRRAP
ncbi:unnamed protein product [Amoebophrya sp. A120]|nr:unnamed protein product [Amoebophrya sp. A120]|eukprot:GSA120T00020662001.1